MNLRFAKSPIPGIILVEPRVHRDDRGFFLESYRRDRYAEGGIDVEFVQDNHSRSTRGTLRGLHCQAPPHGQGKLVRAVEGEIWDVAVDARRGSPTYGQYYGAVLSEENFHQLYVPAGLLHGFVVTSDVAQVQYKATSYYAPEAEFSVVWDDPDLAIPWPIDAPLLSPKDADAPRLRDVQDRLAMYLPPR